MSTATPRVKVGKLSLVFVEWTTMYVQTLSSMRRPRVVLADAP